VDAQGMAQFAYELKTAGLKLGDLVCVIPTSGEHVKSEDIEDIASFRGILVVLASKLENLLVDAQKSQDTENHSMPLGEHTNTPKTIPKP